MKASKKEKAFIRYLCRDGSIHTHTHTRWEIKKMKWNEMENKISSENELYNASTCKHLICTGSVLEGFLH